VIVIVCVSRERGRRVIVKAEHSVRDANSRCVFTDLEVRSQGFYDDIVRARGEMANRSGIDQQLTY
jgi:hypothetical protein